MVVPAEAVKWAKVLSDELIQPGILPEVGGSSSVAWSPTMCPLHWKPAAMILAWVSTWISVVPVHPERRSCSRELELEIKKQEYQVQLLHLRTVEMEADKEGDLRRLSMGEQKLVLLPRRVPKPGTFPHSSMLARDRSDASNAP